MAAPVSPVPSGIPRTGQNPAYRPPGITCETSGRERARGGDRPAPAFDGFDVAALRAFEHDRGQPARHVGAGIDADAVATILRRIADRVAVDDNLAVAVGVRQERLADPAQVVRLLLRDRHARIDAG